MTLSSKIALMTAGLVLLAGAYVQAASLALPAHFV